ncbi:MAG: hypothetical protein AVDCRST_MAG87-185 [uncultured Thermomicrobiales bacterium]|uniref:Uncharacterized protein n=1 Tax=uncultured Thermomicrobiales bacterium TaxID=1645740 RepID=A0A6J4U7D5_9BACT|nr:MAG: hypothetical protein AVDCRST_MAG87-185 [uncultured Thermomicrobiales bacterium]
MDTGCPGGLSASKDRRSAERRRRRGWIMHPYRDLTAREGVKC